MRKVSVIAGSRADFGLLYWSIKELEQHPDFDTQLVLIGALASSSHSVLRHEISLEFPKARSIVSLLANDSDSAVVKSMGVVIMSLADFFEQDRPDLVLVLGDRYEVFAAAVAAHGFGIPVAHLHGGELTEGSKDELVRHAMTKLSAVHFTATESYRKRVLQLGENPEFVFNVGATGLDYLTRVAPLSMQQLREATGIPLGEYPVVLCTFHPESYHTLHPAQQIDEVLAALNEFPSIYFVFTAANADAGGVTINQRIQEYVRAHSTSSMFCETLGQLRYTSLLRYVSGVIGNSSSGIVEAPFCRVGTLNIGRRQAGRERAMSILDVALERTEIANGLATLLSDSFQKGLERVESLYGIGNTASRVVTILASLDFKRLAVKPFYDVF